MDTVEQQKYSNTQESRSHQGFADYFLILQGSNDKLLLLDRIF